mmetsp:Transcript_107208/g.320625  ORF Transcript_107208/g.320625 Transcript_107208/m.320625 type:complete len:530 (+) Transcript_107208:217-1806(+)
MVRARGPGPLLSGVLLPAMLQVIDHLPRGDQAGVLLQGDQGGRGCWLPPGRLSRRPLPLRVRLQLRFGLGPARVGPRLLRLSRLPEENDDLLARQDLLVVVVSAVVEGIPLARVSGYEVPRPLGAPGSGLGWMLLRQMERRQLKVHAQLRHGIRTARPPQLLDASDARSTIKLGAAGFGSVLAGPSRRHPCFLSEIHSFRRGLCEFRCPGAGHVLRSSLLLLLLLLLLGLCARRDRWSGSSSPLACGAVLGTWTSARSTLEIRTPRGARRALRRRLRSSGRLRWPDVRTQASASMRAVGAPGNARSRGSPPGTGALGVPSARAPLPPSALLLPGSAGAAQGGAAHGSRIAAVWVLMASCPLGLELLDECPPRGGRLRVPLGRWGGGGQDWLWRRVRRTSACRGIRGRSGRRPLALPGSRRACSSLRRSPRALGTRSRIADRFDQWVRAPSSYGQVSDHLVWIRGILCHCSFSEPALEGMRGAAGRVIVAGAYQVSWLALSFGIHILTSISAPAVACGTSTNGWHRLCRR